MAQKKTQLSQFHCLFAIIYYLPKDTKIIIIIVGWKITNNFGLPFRDLSSLLEDQPIMADGGAGPSLERFSLFLNV